MRVRWTTDAADDLEQICDYIARDRPGVAHRVADDITKARVDSAHFQIVADWGVSRAHASWFSRRCRLSRCTKFKENSSSSCEYCTVRNDGRNPSRTKLPTRSRCGV
jgi:hypothetical protein